MFFFLRCCISNVTEHRVHASRRRCLFSCRRNSPWVMSRLRSWTGREFHRRVPAAAKVLSYKLQYIERQWWSDRLCMVCVQEAFCGSCVTAPRCRTTVKSVELWTAVTRRGQQQQQQQPLVTFTHTGRVSGRATGMAAMTRRCQVAPAHTSSTYHLYNCISCPFISQSSLLPTSSLLHPFSPPPPTHDDY